MRKANPTVAPIVTLNLVADERVVLSGKDTAGESAVTEGKVLNIGEGEGEETGETREEVVASVCGGA